MLERLTRLLPKLPRDWHGRFGPIYLTVNRELELVAIHTPLGGIRTHQVYSWERQNWIGRGRLEELTLVVTPPLPGLLRRTIEIVGPHKSYRELVGAPENLDDLNWIIDEFDASFNDLATASLRYHLDYSICDNERNREVYEDLIARLNEPSPSFTDEEMAVLHPPGWTFEDDFEEREVNGRKATYLRRSGPEKRAVYDAYHQRQEEYEARILQARHDFVDIMRGLWS